MKKYEYRYPGETVVIDCEEHAMDHNPTDDDTGQGNLYAFEGSFSLEDIAALASLIQRIEAPRISAIGWATMQRSSECELVDVSDGEG